MATYDVAPTAFATYIPRHGCRWKGFNSRTSQGGYAHMIPGAVTDPQRAPAELTPGPNGTFDNITLENFYQLSIHDMDAAFRAGQLGETYMGTAFQSPNFPQYFWAFAREALGHDQRWSNSDLASTPLAPSLNQPERPNFDDCPAFFNWAMFPVVSKQKVSQVEVTAMAMWAVSYSSHPLTPRLTGINPQYEQVDYYVTQEQGQAGVNPDTRSIMVDVSRLSGIDAASAIQSALQLGQPRKNSQNARAPFITFFPIVDPGWDQMAGTVHRLHPGVGNAQTPQLTVAHEYILFFGNPLSAGQDRSLVTGASLGIATLAAIEGMPSIAYTGYVYPVSENVVDRGGQGIVGVPRSFNFVMPVNHLQSKIAGCLLHGIPLCTPYKTVYQKPVGTTVVPVTIDTAEALVKVSEGSRQTMLLRMAPSALTMSDVTSGRNLASDAVQAETSLYAIGANVAEYTLLAAYMAVLWHINGSDIAAYTGADINIMMQDQLDQAVRISALRRGTKKQAGLIAPKSIKEHKLARHTLPSIARLSSELATPPSSHVLSSVLRLSSRHVRLAWPQVVSRRR